jgi:hypothetical protein
MKIVSYPVRAYTWCPLPGSAVEVLVSEDAEVRCVDGIWYVGTVPGLFFIREIRPDGTADAARPARAAFPFPDPAHEVRKQLAQYDRYAPLRLSRPPAIPLPGRPPEPQAGS